MTVTFYGVTVTIEAASAREAYDVLCDILDRFNERHAGGIEWETDTYTIDGGEPRDTRELWPQ